MKYQLLKNTKILKNKAFCCFQSLSYCINPADKCWSANNGLHFNIYEEDKFHIQDADHTIHFGGFVIHWPDYDAIF